MTQPGFRNAECRGRLVWIDGVASVHAYVQSYPLPRFRVYLKHCHGVLDAGGLGVGIHGPIVGNILANDEKGGLIGWILQDVFPLRHPNKEARARAVGDPLFDMVGRKHALKMTDGLIAEDVIVVAENGRV